MSRTLDGDTITCEVIDTPGKRGRKATPPDPDDGRLAAFAHELWALKRRAGDPSFATMCTRLGAAASKSSLAAATRGRALPTWETTWEFVRVLAVEELGADQEETRREWHTRWSATAAGTSSAPAPLPAPAPAAHPGPLPAAQPGPAPAVAAAPLADLTETTPAAHPDPAPAAQADPAPAAAGPDRRTATFRPSRRQVVVAACALATAVAAGIASLAVALPEPKDAQPDSARSAAAPSGATQAGAIQADDAIFEGDVTFPDGSVVAPGQRFTKVWQLRNNGSVRWEGRFLTRMNTTACAAPDMVPIPVTDPGRSVRIQVPVTAGESPANCKIYWKMTDASKRLLLPDKNPIFLDVVVGGPG